MMSAKRRLSHGASFIQMHRWMVESPAWRSLSPYSRCLYMEIKLRYNGSNNGGISLSYREAERLLGCSNKPVPAAFRQLQETGFIKPQQKGAFKGIPLATTWLLTELPQDMPIRSLVPGKDFMNWRAPEKKTRHAESGLSPRRERAANEGAARLERAVSTPRAYCEGQNQAVRSTLKAGTYNIPYTQASDEAPELAGENVTTLPDVARKHPAKSKGQGARRAG